MPKITHKFGYHVIERPHTSRIYAININTPKPIKPPNNCMKMAIVYSKIAVLKARPVKIRKI